MAAGLLFDPENPRSRELQSPPGRTVVVDGAERLYFGGTGYLGLQAHPEVLAAARDALGRYGLHAATSRAFYGATPPLRAAESALASFFGTEAAFLSVTGYAGAVMLARYVGEGVDRVFVDARAHACGWDAARSLARPVHRFAHADPDGLAAALARHLVAGERPLVITDAIDALRGGLIPLPSYRDALLSAGAPGAVLLVDDAHGVGVLGARGRGTLEHFGLDGGDVNRGGDPLAAPRDGAPAVRIVFCATTSKALGGYGGCIVGDAPFVAAVQHASHWYDGASPPPCPVSAATAAALQVAMREPERRQRLAANVRRMRTGLARLGLPIDAAVPTPAIGFALRDARTTIELHQRLDTAGILVPYSASYGGGDDPVGTLRIAVFATHSDEDIDTLLDALARFL